MVKCCSSSVLSETFGVFGNFNVKPTFGIVWSAKLPLNKIEKSFLDCFAKYLYGGLFLEAKIPKIGTFLLETKKMATHSKCT